jgi:chromosome segregation ATPase
MSPGNILELLIILVIVIGIGAAIWRGGARNPVGTGGLDKKLTAIGSDVTGLKRRVGAIEKKVEEETASVDDIRRLEEKLAKLGETLPDIEARQRALADRMAEHQRQTAETATTVKHIDKQVDRIYQVLVPKGMER